MTEHDENLAKLKADMDQMVAATGELARACWGLYSNLVSEGFAAPQALRLTVAWLTVSLGGGATSSDD